MTAGRLVAVAPYVRAGEAREHTEREGVSHLLVLAEGDLVGVVCACDLDDAAIDTRVVELMSVDLVTIDATVTAGAAALCMLEAQVSFLPVLVAGAVVGVITRRDLGRAGILEFASRCSSCGSEDHVRCQAADDGSAGFCLECKRRSSPPGWNDDVGGGAC